MSTLLTLVRYKAWANKLLFDALARIPAAELTAPRPIVFGSILRTVNHVYAMDEVWQANLEGRPHGHTTRNPPIAPSLGELTAAQARMDDWYVSYAESLSPGAEAEKVDFTFIGGGSASLARRDIILHVVNHGTYHRGNVASMLYEVGVVPPTTDLPVYLRA